MEYEAQPDCNDGSDITGDLKNVMKQSLEWREQKGLNIEVMLYSEVPGA
jgi:hypothetical protein